MTEAKKSQDGRKFQINCKPGLVALLWFVAAAFFAWLLHLLSPTATKLFEICTTQEAYGLAAGIGALVPLGKHKVAHFWLRAILACMLLFTLTVACTIAFFLVAGLGSKVPNLVLSPIWGICFAIVCFVLGQLNSTE